MSWHVWVAYTLTEFVLCWIPGPAVLFVTSQAMSGGLRSGVRAAAGIETGNTTYFALTAIGLTTVLRASASVFGVIRWIGAGYLVYIGIRSLLATPVAVGEAPPPVRRSFVRGCIVQLSNPKAVLFFTALVPQFVDTHRGIGLQFLILGATSIVVEMPILVVYSLVSHRLRRSAFVAKWREKIGGSLLVATGARLAVVRAR